MKGTQPCAFMLLSSDGHTVTYIVTFDHLRKLKPEIAFDLAIPLLGIVPKELKSYYSSDPAYSWLQHHNSWKWPIRSSVDKQMNKMCYFNKIEYCSATNEDKAEPSIGKWMAFEPINTSDMPAYMSHGFSYRINLKDK